MRQPGRKRSPVWRASPLKPFDVFPFGSTELTLAKDSETASQPEDPSARVEALFDRTVAVLARREDAATERTGDMVAVTPSAAIVGADDAFKDEGASVTTVARVEDGLAGVASGSFDAVAIDRFAPGRDLRIDLALHPGLTATPLQSAAAPAPGGLTFFEVGQIANPGQFEAPDGGPQPTVATLAGDLRDRSVAAAQ